MIGFRTTTAIDMTYNPYQAPLAPLHPVPQQTLRERWLALPKAIRRTTVGGIFILACFTGYMVGLVVVEHLSMQGIADQVIFVDPDK